MFQLFNLLKSRLNCCTACVDDNKQQPARRRGGLPVSESESTGSDYHSQSLRLDY